LMAAGGRHVYPRGAGKAKTSGPLRREECYPGGRAGLSGVRQQFVKFLSRTGKRSRSGGLRLAGQMAADGLVRSSARKKPALSAVEGSVRATRNTIERLPASPARLFPGTRCNGESRARLQGAWH